MRQRVYRICALRIWAYCHFGRSTSRSVRVVRNNLNNAMHDSCKFDPANPKQQVGRPIFLSLASICLLVIALTGAPISLDFIGLGVHPNIAAAMGGGKGNGGSNAGIGEGAEGGEHESDDNDPGNSLDHNRAGWRGGDSDGSDDGSDDGSGGGDDASQTSLGGSGGLFGQYDGGESGPGIGSAARHRHPCSRAKTPPPSPAIQPPRPSPRRR